MDPKINLLIAIALSSYCVSTCPRDRSDFMVNKQAKIVGGTPAKQGEIPYQLSLQLQEGLHICGASLTQVLDTQVAISAAHCVANSNKDRHFTLVAGEIDLRDTSGFEQIRRVKKFVAHEQFSWENTSNDLALLFLDRPFELKENVGIIQLPTESENTVGSLRVSGWGSLYGRGPTSENLQMVNLPVVDHEICSERWKCHPQSPVQIGEGILCAGVSSGKQSHCNGDSGGPARCGDYLAGVISFADRNQKHE